MMDEYESKLREGLTLRALANDGDEGLSISAKLADDELRLKAYEQAARTGDMGLASALTDGHPEFAFANNLMPGQIGWAVNEQAALAGGADRTGTAFDDQTGTVAKAGAGVANEIAGTAGEPGEDEPERMVDINELLGGADAEALGFAGQIPAGMIDAMTTAFLGAQDLGYEAVDWARGLVGAPPVERSSALYKTLDFLRDNDLDFIRPAGGIGGSISRSMSQFLTAFLPASKALGMLGATGGVVQATGAGMVADFAVFEAHEGNMVSMFREFGMEAEWAQYLDSAEADTELQGRLRNALVGALIGVPVEYGLRAAGAVTKAAMDRESAEKLADMMMAGARGVRAFGRDVVGRLGDVKVTSGGPGTQQGKIGYHGTLHEFDDFSTSKIGEGTGQQMEGHGLYFAEVEGVARAYKDLLTSDTDTPRLEGGKDLPLGTMRAVQDLADRQGLLEIDQLAEALEGLDGYEDALAAIRSGDLKFAEVGSLYTVDIKDEAIETFLDLNKPISEQTPAVKKALSEYMDVETVVNRTKPGEFVLRELEGAMGMEKASQFLNTLGIRGTRFLDRGSRADGAGKGTQNYVVFNDEDVRTLYRNGKEIGQPPPVAGEPLPQPEAERTAAHVLQRWDKVEGGLKAQARALQDRTLRALKGQPLPDAPKDWTPEHRQSVARMMAADVKTALGDKETGQHWYKEKVDAAHRALALKFPAIKEDPSLKTFANFALAITSQGTKVSENSRNAIHAFDVFTKTGKFPTEGLLGGGKSVNIQRAAFEKFNAMRDEWGDEWLFAFMNTDFTVKQLKEVGITVSGENMNALVPGSSVFGPKIGGGFFSNMNGRYDMLTMDMWWRRTWGRYTGKIMAPEEKIQAAADKFGEGALANPELMKRYGLSKKALRTKQGRRDAAAKVWLQFASQEKYGKVPGAPKNELANLARSYAALAKPIEAMSGGERGLMREVARDALDLLRADGVEVDMADLQALLWYLEKDIYGKMGQKVERKAFDEAIADELIREGYSHDDVQRALAGDALGESAPDAGGGGVPGGNRGPALDLREEARRARLGPEDQQRALDLVRQLFGGDE